jgi:phasin family protein
MKKETDPIHEETDPIHDLTRLMTEFKVPGVDLAPIIESRRKDMEALVASNRAAYDAMQALARKQTELMTQAMQAIQQSMQGVAAGPAAIDPAKQMKLVSDAYQKALSDLKEFADIARKSQVDAMSGIAHRAGESLKEMQQLMKASS